MRGTLVVTYSMLLRCAMFAALTALAGCIAQPADEGEQLDDTEAALTAEPVIDRDPEEPAAASAQTAEGVLDPGGTLPDPDPNPWRGGSLTDPDPNPWKPSLVDSTKTSKGDSSESSH